MKFGNLEIIEGISFEKGFSKRILFESNSNNIYQKKSSNNTNSGLFLLSALVLIQLLIIYSGTSVAQNNRLLNKFTTDAGCFYYNPPTIVNGYVYIGMSEAGAHEPVEHHYLYKLDRNLNIIWKYDFGKREIRGGATLDSQGNIYFVIEEGRSARDCSNVRQFLYSLDNDGNYRWNIEITTSSIFTDCMWGMYNPAISSDDTIYIGSGKMYAFDADGNIRWTFESQNQTMATDMDIKNGPIIDNCGNIYFIGKDADNNVKVFSLSPNGHERWTYNTYLQTNDHFSSPAFSTDFSRVYVAIRDTIYCLNSSNGNVSWTFKPSGISGTFKATPAVDSQNNVYVGTKADNNSVFYAIKSDGTTLLWQNPIGADLYSSPAIGDNGRIYVGSEISASVKKSIYALNINSGQIQWALHIDNIMWSSAAIIDTGTLYIASMPVYRGEYSGNPGSIYAIKTDSTGLSDDAGSPRFHGGNANTGRRGNMETENCKKFMPWLPLVLDKD